MDDDLVRDMLITKDGKIVNEKINFIYAKAVI
ncbi:hypothetical protein A1E_05520 [Rickettsia canadensis str. McKiel]|uniref:Uncharacterized protein n=1 Tax=Rickettsia canadensis (strain McKiel) TaxID=293613 RepID=A8F085_RICCK|nr:hypothetical protein A1E_05520 [Rickettsia canadensis str. McKiel]